MIHGGGGAKCVERENKGHMEINVYLCIRVCHAYVDKCVNNIVQFMYHKKDCINLE